MAAIPQRRSPTIDAIYQVYEQREAEREGERDFIGIYDIGHVCRRRPWYAFRWAHEPERKTGERLREFRLIQLHRKQVIADLKALGLDVTDVTYDGFYLKFDLVGDHVRTENLITATGVIEAPKARHVVEIHSLRSKDYKTVISKGLKEGKPDRYVKLQLSMHGAAIDRGLYVAEERETGQIHIERVHYDPVFSGERMAQAENIVRNNHAPPKLHEDPMHKMAFKCGSCPAYGVCHGGAWPRTNCRTCLHSTPSMDGDGGWHCGRHGHFLTTEDQKTGCPNHLFIPDLVPGKQIDADPEAETVTYLLPSGQEWTDGTGKAVR
ncbi:hypothetical protein B0E33_01420 [Roseibium algicola]|uniref:PD-(D/E)XK nuclease superfamily protein n=1 Tax=Roseibium algicola TaxID=2857014 RepID=A0ABM6HWL0_9HYPH|nr:hypothetical protein [Roseibium aggregatum]AQQ02415.1 hypothetical protein B0E33_01420 [Roseibium aggregatum]